MVRRIASWLKTLIFYFLDIAIQKHNKHCNAGEKWILHQDKATVENIKD